MSQVPADLLEMSKEDLFDMNCLLAARVAKADQSAAFWRTGTLVLLALCLLHFIFWC